MTLAIPGIGWKIGERARPRWNTVEIEQCALDVELCECLPECGDRIAITANRWNDPYGRSSCPETLADIAGQHRGRPDFDEQIEAGLAEIGQSIRKKDGLADI